MAGLATIGVLLIRTRREERDLRQAFGDRYLAYRERTGWILPGLKSG